MKKNIMIIDSFQAFITEKIIERIAEKYDYKKKYRKLSMQQLFIYLCVIALEQCKSYREAVTLAKKYGLPEVHYSELSKRISEMPYEITKELFECIISECNRSFRRKTKKAVKIEKKILAIDSTTITTSKFQLKWAGFKGQRAGIKLHVQFDVNSYMPTAVQESLAKNHDSKFADELKDEESILVEDRAYGKVERFDAYVSEEERQSFVIRIKNNLTMTQSRKLKRLKNDDSNIIDDVTCQLGKGDRLSKNRFRIVTFKDNKENIIKVCTDLMHVTSETIAEIYKSRWTIETFFRFIKQNLNLSRIFGTTKNAVFNQLYTALLVFVLIRFLYVHTSEQWKITKMTAIEFIRTLRCNNCIAEVYISIYDLLHQILET